MKLTREQAFDIITSNGIVLHECNKQETSTNDIFYMTDEELLLLLNDECGMNVSEILHACKTMESTKMIVYDCNGYHATDPANYNSFIMDTWKIFDLSNFETREQITEYFKKYFGIMPEQIVFIN